MRILALVAFFALLFAIACGGNSSSSSNTGSDNTGPSGSTSGSNSGGNGSGSGSLQAGTYVFVANQGTGTISTFRLGTDGSLTPSGTPVASPGVQRLATIGSNYVVSSERASSSVHLFAINQSTGALSSIGSSIMQSPPNAIATDSTRSLIYAATDNGIYAFSVSSSGLKPLAGSPYFTNQAGQDPRGDKQARSVLVDPSGKFIFAGFGGYHGSGFIAAISRDASGALTTEAVAIADGPSSLAALWNGSILYGDNPILGFHVAGSGALTPVAGGPVITGEHLASDPSSHFMLATEEGFNNANGKVHVYSVDQSSGFANEVSGSPFSSQGVGPSMVKFDPSGTFAVVVNGSTIVTTTPSNSIAVFRFNGSNGTLTSVGSPTSTDSQPSDVAFVTISGT